MIGSGAMRSYAGALLFSVALAATAACGGGAAPIATPPLPTVTTAPPTAIPPLPAVTTAPRSAAGAEPPSLQILLASSDLGVGQNRLAFGLIDRQSGPVTDANVEASTFYLEGGSQEGPIETKQAVFRKWPVGSGVYTTQFSFDRPGKWGLAVAITYTDGATAIVSAGIDVKEESATPAIGSAAVRSVSKTARDVESLDQMTTDRDPDPEMYAMTIAEALDSGKPLVLVFSTPAFCETATCGPQLDVVKGLKTQNEGKVNFIHIEVYDNPLEIQGDLRRGIISPTLTEWNLPSEPWTFVIDGEGLVQAKFEGFATSRELEEALATVLR